MTLHDNITRRRVALGLSRRKVADQLGVTERQWWRLETDRVQIRAYQMPWIAKALKTTVSLLIGDAVPITTKLPVRPRSAARRSKPRDPKLAETQMRRRG